MHKLPGLLQGVENTLAEERKARSTVAHPLDEFQFVHFSLDDPIADWQGQASLDRLFVSYYSGDKTLELADMAFFYRRRRIIGSSNFLVKRWEKLSLLLSSRPSILGVV